jgi:Mg/Co/Ni transporter MgtE
MRYVTISVKIPRELKELMDKYGIKPSTVIRRALEEEVKKKILEETENKAKELINKVTHISDKEIARIIREDRDGR